MDFDVDKQISLMVVTTEHERAMNAETTYFACFKGVDRKRTLIAMGIYCVQTLSGNPLRGYSTYFLTKAGLPSVQAFNMSLVNNAMALTGGLFTVTFALFQSNHRYPFLRIYGRLTNIFLSVGSVTSLWTPNNIYFQSRSDDDHHALDRWPWTQHIQPLLGLGNWCTPDHLQLPL